MPPFQPKAMVPVPAPTQPSSTAPDFALCNRGEHLVVAHVAPLNIIEHAVVGFADQGIDGPNLRGCRRGRACS